MIVDLDDAHQHQHRIDLLARLHEANPRFRVTLFTVPFLSPDDWLDELPEWIEVVPHGWKHPHARECENWTYERMLELIDACEGSRLVHGWKSPGWQISDGTYQACLERGWWVADQPYNDHRRPPGLLTHRLGDGDHVHGHIPNVCGNGIEETFDLLMERVRAATEFQFVSEVVKPWLPVEELVEA